MKSSLWFVLFMLPISWIYAQKIRPQSLLKELGIREAHTYQFKKIPEQLVGTNKDSFLLSKEYFNPFGYITKTEGFDSTGVVRLRVTNTYQADTMLLESIAYADDTLFYHYTYAYNDKGQKQKMTAYNRHGKPSQTTTFHYKEGRMYQEKSYHKGEWTTTQTYKYRKDGTLKKKVSTSKLGNHHTIVYDEKGEQMVKSISRKGTTKRGILENYQNTGQTVHRYYKKKVLLYEYYYSKEGLQISHKRYENGTCSFAQKTYYF